MVTWASMSPYGRANVRIVEYLREKQQMGFINHYALFSSRAESGANYYIHGFHTTRRYFKTVLSSAIAWMCFDLKVLPQIESPSLSTPAEYSMGVYWSIKFHPYHAEVPPILEEHVPSIEKHLKMVYNVVWKPPRLEG